MNVSRKFKNLSVAIAPLNLYISLAHNQFFLFQWTEADTECYLTQYTHYQQEKYPTLSLITLLNWKQCKILNEPKLVSTRKQTHTYPAVLIVIEDLRR